MQRTRPARADPDNSGPMQKQWKTVATHVKGPSYIPHGPSSKPKRPQSAPLQRLVYPTGPVVLKKPPYNTRENNDNWLQFIMHVDFNTQNRFPNYRVY